MTTLKILLMSSVLTMGGCAPQALKPDADPPQPETHLPMRPGHGDIHGRA